VLLGQDTITATVTVMVILVSPPPFPFTSATTVWLQELQVQQLDTAGTADLEEMEEVLVAEVVAVEASLTPVVMVVDPLEAVVDLEERAGFKISGMEYYPAFGYLGQDRRRTGTMVWLGERSWGRSS
jgi:hypothetical protein